MLLNVISSSMPNMYFVYSLRASVTAVEMLLMSLKNIIHFVGGLEIAPLLVVCMVAYSRFRHTLLCDIYQVMCCGASTASQTGEPKR